ncbi:MAG: HD domain-containing phosphohydrolase, partial [Oscillospiraceae bacterium]
VVTDPAFKATADEARGDVYVAKNDMLHFKILRNHTLNTYQGSDGEEVDLPPVPITEHNVCSYVLIHKHMENIDDVYCSDKFDFSGPMDYDLMTGYRTKSMMVIPLENNKGMVVGVLQLLNAKDKNNQTIPFNKIFEKIFCSIASQAAIAVTNMQYTQDIKELFQSLIMVLAAAIDERSPYNANHTKNVADLVANFVDFVNLKHKNGQTKLFFDHEMREQMIISSWLHDIGKIITPLEIMDKSSKLGSKYNEINMRLNVAYYELKAKGADNETDKEIFEQAANEVLHVQELITRINNADQTDPNDLLEINKYADRTLTLPDGKVLPWITPDEFECLNIKYGTLTHDERKIMEDHVVITKRLLDKIKFTSEYKDVAFLAASHHERLNGSGYPNGLTAEQLPIPSRIITVMDIFDSLIAKDRPYKKAVPIKQAFKIIDKLVAKGDIDGEIVELLKEQYRSKI